MGKVIDMTKSREGGRRLDGAATSTTPREGHTLKTDDILAIITRYNIKALPDPDAVAINPAWDLTRAELELIDIEMALLSKASARLRSPFDDDILRQLLARVEALCRLTERARDNRQSRGEALEAAPSSNAHLRPLKSE